ncbi:MAG TPA: hypothetical protein VFO48_05850 [Vicinamibacterales bacterium]|nr:hypothetical protein [Vicinamibacterales bacterium]
MSPRVAGAVLALVFAGSSGLLAEPGAQQQETAVESLSSGLKHLEKARLSDAKRTYMYLFVHNRTASNELMKAMKAWVKKERGQHVGIDAASFEAFDAWVRERDALAAAVVNLGHNSPDWK